MVDKNQAIIDYLLQCTYVKNNPLFFNFGNAKNGNSQIVVNDNDKTLNKKYIDGSELKQYTFNLLVYKSISYNPVVTVSGYTNENVEEILDIQGIIDWITEQDGALNYPDFGTDCIIDSIEALSNNPSMNGVNASTTPPLATYGVSIKVVYLDTTNAVWK